MKKRIGFSFIFLVCILSLFVFSAHISLAQHHKTRLVVIDTEPIPIREVYPEYSQSLAQGMVAVNVFVDERGNVTKAVILKSDSHIFNKMSVTTAKKWKFKPAQKNGKDVGAWVIIQFTFTLSGKK